MVHNSPLKWNKPNRERDPTAVSLSDSGGWTHSDVHVDVYTPHPYLTRGPEGHTRIWLVKV